MKSRFFSSEKVAVKRTKGEDKQVWFYDIQRGLRNKGHVKKGI